MSRAMRNALIGLAVAAGVIAAVALLRLPRPSSLSTETSGEGDSARESRPTTGTPAAGSGAPDGLTDGLPHLAKTDSFPLPEILIDPEIVIEKEYRALTVLSGGEAVKRYRIALGRTPAGHKQREGDNRTPEGSYYICTKNAASKYHRSLGLSYPNDDDADVGLATGLISRKDHKAIVTAIRKMAQPPWNTKLGGEIMIHGGGSGRGDWTEGCIALDDSDAEELFSALPMGAPVTIRP